VGGRKPGLVDKEWISGCFQDDLGEESSKQATGGVQREWKRWKDNLHKVGAKRDRVSA
jgi:hypothetical protein